MDQCMSNPSRRWRPNSRIEATRREFLSAWVGLGAALTSGCGSSARNLGVSRIDGSSTMFPLMEAVIEQYRRQNPGFRFTIAISGTSGGFRKLIRGDASLIGASRPISSEELDSAHAAAVDFIEIPVALDGIVLAVNPANDWCRELRLRELRSLWEAGAQGRITNWSQLRPEWPDQRIRLFGPGADSGTYDTFSRAVVGRRGATRGDFASSEDDNVLVRGVAGDPYALGFFSYSYYQANADRLRLLGLENRDGETVLPSLKSIGQGRYSPLTRPLFLYLRADDTERRPWPELIAFYLEEAPQLAAPLGFAPLSPGAYTAAADRLRRRITGTFLDGSATVPEDVILRIREGRFGG